MFAMYDDDGLNFRSTIDTLYTVQKVEASKRAKNDPYEEKDHTQNSFDSFYKGKTTQEAKNKYKQMLNLDTKAEIFHVEQVMSYNTTIINDTTTIQECYDLMEQNKVQQLLIRADKGNHLKGMITKQEILDFIINNLSLNNIQNIPINQIAQKNIITTDPITDIRRAAKVMCDFNINALPVVDADDSILGVVSRFDIVKAVSNIPHLQIWA